MVIFADIVRSEGKMGISYKPLFKLLIDRGIKKSDLKDLVGISLPTLAKLSKGEPISGTTIEKLCKYFNCQPGDIMEYVPDTPAK
jgi:DNA-binding Xre family transcriptional regulator